VDDKDCHFRVEYQSDEDEEPTPRDYRACTFAASQAEPRDAQEASEIAEVGFAKLDRVTDFREFARLRQLAEKHKFRR